MLNKTSSYICGRWYFPVLLFREGLLTLKYRASFITLLRFWTSLPTMLKLSTLMLWPVVLKWSNMGEGAFWCSLNLSPNALEDSYIFLITLHHTTFVTIDDPTLLQHRIFVLWGHQEVFDGCTSSKVNLNPIVIALHFLHSHSAPCSMVHWCRVSGCCSAEWYLDCSFSFELGCSSSSSLYSRTIWGNYSSSVFVINVLPPAAATGYWNIWS